MGGCEVDKKTVVLIAISAGLAFGDALAQSSDSCGKKNETHKIDVSIDPESKSVSALNKGGKSSDVLHVCPGDTVEWKLSFKDDLAFYLMFDDDAPVSDLDKHSKNKRLTTRILDDAPRGASFAYHLRLINGDAVSPVIVID